MKEKFPELKNQEISVKLGEAWKALSDDVRKPFMQKAADARAERRLKAQQDVAAAVKKDQKKHKHKHKRDRSASPPPRPKKGEKKKESRKKKKERRSDTESDSDSSSGSDSD